MFDKYTENEIKITKAICLETLIRNYEFKKTKPDKNEVTGKSWIDNFRWKCFDSMDDKNKRIHLKRTRLLIQSGCKILPPEKIHDFFVSERLLEGWILEDERLDRDSNGAWLGHDPMLKPIKDCPPGFYDYCVMRNEIAHRIVKKGLKELY